MPKTAAALRSPRQPDRRQAHAQPMARGRPIAQQQPRQQNRPKRHGVGQQGNMPGAPIDQRPLLQPLECLRSGIARTVLSAPAAVVAAIAASASTRRTEPRRPTGSATRQSRMARHRPVPASSPPSYKPRSGWWRPARTARHVAVNGRAWNVGQSRAGNSSDSGVTAPENTRTPRMKVAQPDPLFLRFPGRQSMSGNSRLRHSGSLPYACLRGWRNCCLKSAIRCHRR